MSSVPKQYTLSILFFFNHSITETVELTTISSVTLKPSFCNTDEYAFFDFVELFVNT